MRFSLGSWCIFPLVAGLVLAINYAAAQQRGSSADSNPCVSKLNCSECIRTPTCAWCAQHDFGAAEGGRLPRCNQQNKYIDGPLAGQCRLEDIVNPDSEFRAILDLALSKAKSGIDLEGTEGRDAVQIKPQRVSLKLRINEAYDMHMQYAQAEDYPVDLYYLMDLSKSMEDDKDKLSELGNLLAERMQSITSNFRLGFGSFVDKVVMPYVSTVPAKLLEPCDGCKAPYGFKNHMPLSLNSTMFSSQVRKAAVSGNLDAPEGGFDAIMQAIVCKERIGWRDRARRLLVFSTDASFHYAGDGKLGGIVKPNDGLCHLNNDGGYTHSTTQDYPSVSQINQKVKESSVNLIFAVTKEQYHIYEQLNKHVEGASCGVLSNDSSNVVELVQEQYNKITSSVEMKDNATGAVKVTYFSNCLGNGPMVQTNKCDGLKVGTVVNFTARIELSGCPIDPKEWRQLFQIYPVGINESLVVDLQMLCDCDCERPGNLGYISNADQCNGGGDLKCGICHCDDSHSGRFCECDSNTAVLGDHEASCRSDNTSDILCNDRGTCVCGVCECQPRPNPTEIITGQFCECDNFSCDYYNGLPCAGSDHGTCECGKCVCKPGWKGSDCSCRDSIDTCIPPRGGEICSGKGDCVCGECQCFEEDGGRYSGKYCEECPTCPSKCPEYTPCIQCQVFESGKLTKEECANCSFTPVEVDVVKEEFPSDRQCWFYDDDDCRVTFVYGYDDEGEFVVRVQKTKECPPVLNILGIILGVIGAVVAIGFALLLLWKLFTVIHDRREFARFEKERQMAKWDTGENPIYKQATSTFKNPTYGGKQ
ncbi:integrin beta-PS isoform X1 [Daphnia magna]|uniref:Integrin beta n=1 Tax=Daphnia magna TaxID=35525 RepID=A0A0P5IU01_9CRUS|nr:integrin beta-PS isoform X1 [Daphnia magna]XP_045025981.1 integrin beta-PS isoform X1 [Daphnia magna]